MAAQPLPIPFTARELERGRQIAAALWLFSAMLIAVVTAWSAGPHLAG
ncbi:MAG: hypothetical protein AB1716_18005 [Planctomycetota bacterium]